MRNSRLFVYHRPAWRHNQHLFAVYCAAQLSNYLNIVYRIDLITLIELFHQPLVKLPPLAFGNLLQNTADGPHVNRLAGQQERGIVWMAVVNGRQKIGCRVSPGNGHINRH